MNWTGGRLRRHSEINSKARKQNFGKARKTGTCSKGSGPHQITLFRSKLQDQERVDSERRREGDNRVAAEEVRSFSFLTTCLLTGPDDVRLSDLTLCRIG